MRREGVCPVGHRPVTATARAVAARQLARVLRRRDVEDMTTSVGAEMARGEA